MKPKPSEILRRAKEIRNAKYPNVSGGTSLRLAWKELGADWDTFAQADLLYFGPAELDFDQAIALALFDEAKAVVDSGIVDSFEIALTTIRMTLPEQVAVVALAVRKGIEISDLARWGLKE
jgi:radical SAM superfamily enzyme YgiQ (UPF0313 family)